MASFLLGVIVKFTGTQHVMRSLMTRIIQPEAIRVCDEVNMIHEQSYCVDGIMEIVDEAEAV